MAGRWMWAVGGLAAVAGVGAGVAFAEGEMRGGDGWQGHRGGMGGMFHRTRTKEDVLERARARFARIDANSDGTADRDEIGAMIERRMERRGGRWGGGRGMQRRGERMLRRLDVNRDGRVTEDEIRARVGERFARGDLDADGAITDADLPPMLRGRDVLKSDTGWMPRRRWARRLARLRMANVNNDDRVTLEEVQAMAIARFARFDANKDGAIDNADADARRAEMKDYRVSRMLARFGAAGQDGVTREAFLTQVEQRFASRDLDGDGMLDRGEMRRGRHGGKYGGRREGRYEGHGYHRGQRHGWRRGGDEEWGGARRGRWEDRGEGPAPAGEDEENRAPPSAPPEDDQAPGPERTLDRSPDWSSGEATDELIEISVDGDDGLDGDLIGNVE